MLNSREMRCPLSTLRPAGTMATHRVPVDHSTTRHRAVPVVPLLDKIFRKYKYSVGGIWRVNQMYFKVHGELKYLHRAIDVAQHQNGTPEKFPWNKNGADKAVIEQISTDRNASITAHLAKYPNDVPQQNHPAADRVSKPKPGFKSFRSVGKILAGAEPMHMIYKAKPHREEVDTMSVADQFHVLAGSVHPD